MLVVEKKILILSKPYYTVWQIHSAIKNSFFLIVDSESPDVSDLSSNIKVVHIDSEGKVLYESDSLN